MLYDTPAFLTSSPNASHPAQMIARASRSTEIAWGVFAAILLFSLRELNTSYSFWLDEAFSVDAVTRSWSDLLRILLADIHPPIYLVTLKIWTASAGSGESQTRLLSFLLAALAAALVWGALRRHSKNAANWGLVFFVASPWFPFMANEVRSYALLWALAAVALWWLPLQRPVTWQWGLAGILMAGTHYTGLMVFLALSGALVLISIPNWAKAFRLCFAAVPGLIWPLGHFLLGNLAQGTSSFHIKAGETFWSFNRAAEGLGGAISELPQSGLLFVLILIAATTFSLFAAKRQPEHKEAAVLFGGALILVLGVACIDLIRPISSFRYYLAALPFLAAACGILLGGMQSRGVQAGATVLLLLGIIAGTTNLKLKAREGENWKGAADAIMAQGGGRVVSTYPQPLSLYLRSANSTDRVFYVVGHVEGSQRAELLRRLQSSTPIFPIDQRGFDATAKVLVFCRGCVGR